MHYAWARNGVANSKSCLQLVVLLSIPLVLGMSSFLIAYIPNRKAVEDDTKREKTQRPKLSSCLADVDTKLCSDKPIEKLMVRLGRGEFRFICTRALPKLTRSVLGQAIGFWGIVVFGLVFLGKNLMCGLQWLGAGSCATKFDWNATDA